MKYMIPLFSLIIPCYKVERYIRKCLDSILNQSFQDWEALLIDDGSPDNCGNICDEYVGIDARFRVFHKDNGGVSSARNLGLDNACGKWVWYIDPDDWIASDALLILSRYIQDYNADAIIFGLQRLLDTGEKLAKSTYTFSYGHANNVLELFDYAPSSVILQRKIIEDNHLRFSSGIRMYEDLEFQYKFLMSTDLVLLVPEILYFMLIREGSAVRNPSSIQNAAEDIPQVLCNLVDFISINKIQERDWIAARINRTIKSAMYMNALSPQKNIKNVQCVIQQVDKQLRNLGYKKYRDIAVRIGCIDIHLYFMCIRLRKTIKRITL